MLFAKLGLTRKTLGTCLLLSAMAGAAALLSTPAPASAAMKCGSEITYYSDATHSHIVGLRGWLPPRCNCQAYGSGSTSAFYTIASSVC